MPKRRVSKQIEHLAHKAGQPASWVADQVAARLVPDVDLPPAAQKAAWSVIRSVRTRGVPADVVAVQAALHGDRGVWTSLLPDAVLRLTTALAVDMNRTDDRGHRPGAEQAVAEMFDGERPAPGPLAGVVRRVLTANGAALPANGEGKTVEVSGDLAALAATVVGMEDMWSSMWGCAATNASPEMFAAAQTLAPGDPDGRHAEAVFGRRALSAFDDVLTPDELRRIRTEPESVGWPIFLGALQRMVGDRSIRDACVDLVRLAPKDVLVAALRSAAEMPFDAMGIDTSTVRVRAGVIACQASFVLLTWVPAVPSLARALTAGTADDSNVGS